MQEEGIVVEIETGATKVKVERHGACGNCRICFAGVGEESKQMFCLAKNPLEAKVGQRVRLETDTAFFLKASFLIYIFPLIGLFSGYLVARVFFKEEWPSLLFGLLGLVFFFLIPFWYNRKVKREKEPRIKITEIIS